MGRKENLRRRLDKGTSVGGGHCGPSCVIEMSGGPQEFKGNLLPLPLPTEGPNLQRLATHTLNSEVCGPWTQQFPEGQLPEGMSAKQVVIGSVAS